MAERRRRRNTGRSTKVKAHTRSIGGKKVKVAEHTRKTSGSSKRTSFKPVARSTVNRPHSVVVEHHKGKVKHSKKNLLKRFLAKSRHIGRKIGRIAKAGAKGYADYVTEHPYLSALPAITNLLE